MLQLLAWVILYDTLALAVTRISVINTQLKMWSVRMAPADAAATLSRHYWTHGESLIRLRHTML